MSLEEIVRIAEEKAFTGFTKKDATILILCRRHSKRNRLVSSPHLQHVTTKNPQLSPEQYSHA